MVTRELKNAKIIANLWLANFILTAAVSSYAPFVPLIKNGLGFSFSEFGLLSTAFYVPYTLMQPFSGRSSDRGRARTLILIGLPVLLVATMLLGQIQSIEEALALRGVAGAFGALLFVPSLRTLADLEENRAAMSIAIFGTSSPVASLYISLAGPILATDLGWRLAFPALMAPGFIIWAFNLRHLRGPSTSIRRLGSDIASGESELSSLRYSSTPLWTLKHRETWLLGCQQFARIGLLLAVSAWLPTFFTTGLGYNLVLGGASLGLFSIFAIPSSLLGGHFASKYKSSSKVSTTSFAAIGICFICIAFATGISAWAIDAAIGLFGFMSFAPLFAILPILYEKRVIGFVTGIEAMFANMGAMLLPYIFGNFVDITGHFETSWILLGSICILAFLAGLPLVRVERKGNYI